MMKDRLIVVGSSYSGVAANTQLIRQLPAGLPAAVLVIQHMPRDRLGALPGIFARGALPVLHPAQFEPIRSGRIYVAPPDRHMLITPERRIFLAHGPEENLERPAIDATLRSAALTNGPAVIAVLLTGELMDGTAGALAVKDHGGLVVVQDPEEVETPSMALAVAGYVDVDHCSGSRAMGQLLTHLAYAPSGPSRVAPWDSLLHIEGRIASGLLDAGLWARLRTMSKPSTLECPACGQAMLELGDSRVRRFRCRAGHASAADALDVETLPSLYERAEGTKPV